MKKHILYSFLFCIVSTNSFSQSKFNTFLKPSDTLNSSRKKAVFISEVSLAGLSLVGLNQLWYKDYEKSSFHTINDTDEWLQMDKLGHSFSAYQLTKLGADTFKWSGATKKQQLIYGAALSMSFLTTVEVFDGVSKEWGFSWSDIAANTFGTGLFVGQELLWNEQRVLLKYSFHQTHYANKRPEKLGENMLEQLLKDYNGQTYWLSANVHSFFKTSSIPKWLNVAFGYGAHGMLTGQHEPNNIEFPNQNRQRQFYVSLDVDLTKIKTKSHTLKTLFSLLNVVKVPMPTIEFNNKKSPAFHLLYF